MSSNADMGIHILGVKGLGHGQSLLVVEVAGERFLLGACKDKIVYLARLTGDERVGNASSAVGEGR
jgi:flagellar biogenesis protein FliO